MRRYNIAAQTEAGDTFETQVDAHDEFTAGVEAKIEVEKWLGEIDQSADRLSMFAIVSSQPL